MRAKKEITKNEFVRLRIDTVEKDRLEKQVKTMMATQTTLTTKFLPKVRELERKRLSHQK